MIEIGILRSGPAHIQHAGRCLRHGNIRNLAGVAEGFREAGLETDMAVFHFRGIESIPPAAVFVCVANVRPVGAEGNGVVPDFDIAQNLVGNTSGIVEEDSVRFKVLHGRVCTDLFDQKLVERVGVKNAPAADSSHVDGPHVAAVLPKTVQVRVFDPVVVGWRTVGVVHFPFTVHGLGEVSAQGDSIAGSVEDFAVTDYIVIRPPDVNPRAVDRDEAKPVNEIVFDPVEFVAIFRKLMGFPVVGKADTGNPHVLDPVAVKGIPFVGALEVDPVHAGMTDMVVPYLYRLGVAQMDNAVAGNGVDGPREKRIAGHGCKGVGTGSLEAFDYDVMHRGVCVLPLQGNKPVQMRCNDFLPVQTAEARPVVERGGFVIQIEFARLIKQAEGALNVIAGMFPDGRAVGLFRNGDAPLNRID